MKQILIDTLTDRFGPNAGANLAVGLEKVIKACDTRPTKADLDCLIESLTKVRETL